MTKIIQIFENSKIYQILRKIFLLFSVSFRETFIYKFFMSEFNTKRWENSFIYKFLCKLWGLAGWFSKILTGSFTYQFFHKRCMKTTVSNIIANSSILKRCRVSGEGYTFAFLIFLMLLFLAGILPTMVVVALTVLALGFSLLESNFRNNLTNNKPIFSDILIACYLIVLILGLFLSIDPGKYQIFLVYFTFVGFYYVVRYFVSSERRLLLSISYFTLSGIFVCGFGILQFLTGKYQTTTWTDTSLFTDIAGRIYSTFQNPNVFGEYLLFLIPLSLAMFLISKDKLHKTIYGICCACAALCMILTYSRGCWLGLIAGMGLFIVLLYKKALIPIGMLAPFSVFLLPQSILNRFMSIGNLADSSTAYRVYIWRGTVKMLRKFWPIGAGIGTHSFEVAYAPFALPAITAPHSHSLYFHLMTEAGIFSLLTFVVLMYIILRQLFLIYKHPKNREMQVLSIALVSGFVSFLIQGFFDNTFYNYRMYMLFFALVSLAASLYAVGGKQSK